MKKILLILAVAAIALPSCKKDYTCTCVDNTPNPDPDAQFKYTKVKKKDAKKSCDALNTLYSPDMTCTLK